MARRTFSVLGLGVAALALAACQTLTLPGTNLSVPLHKPVVAERPFYSVGEPYEIDGVTYRPAEDWSYDETGIASWYGEDFQGKYTANGEIFDMNALTAAHRTLPLPSIVQVTELETGRSIRVRVNDRGPYDGGRILDLSRRAAQLLGYETKGTAKVRVQILFVESLAAAKLAGRKGPDPQNPAEQPKPVPTDKISRADLPPPSVELAATAPVVEGPLLASTAPKKDRR
jgi:rare lipoprotein A